MVTYSSLKGVEKPSLGVSCSSFEWHVSIIDSFPTGRNGKAPGDDAAGKLNQKEEKSLNSWPRWPLHGVQALLLLRAGRLVPSFRSPFCPRWRRQVGQAQAGTGPDGFISGPHFLFLLYTDRGWLLWYRLYSTDRIGSFFSSWSSSSLSLLSSHACCIYRPWMCWVPTSYCLLFSAGYATKSLTGLVIS